MSAESDFIRIWESEEPMLLNPWEEDFCESIYERLTEDKLDLTEAQEKVLDRILDKNRDHRRRNC